MYVEEKKSYQLSQLSVVLHISREDHGAEQHGWILIKHDMFWRAILLIGFCVISSWKNTYSMLSKLFVRNEGVFKDDGLSLRNGRKVHESLKEYCSK